MKRNFYILFFTFLGLLLGFLVHGLVEIAVIVLLVRDFDKWGLGFSWDTWFLFHYVWAFITLLAGIVFGYKQGIKWWNTIYVKKFK
jgi:hypothetical protein